MVSGFIWLQADGSMNTNRVREKIHAGTSTIFTGIIYVLYV